VAARPGGGTMKRGETSGETAGPEPRPSPAAERAAAAKAAQMYPHVDDIFPMQVPGGLQVYKVTAATAMRVVLHPLTTRERLELERGLQREVAQAEAATRAQPWWRRLRARLPRVTWPSA
jgi:hypothetical protein